MRKRLISGIMVATIMMGTSYQAFATPTIENNKIDDVRAQYSAVTDRIKGLETKIDDINKKMEPVYFAMEDNKAKIATIESEIVNTTSKIEESKKEIDEKQKILDIRLRETYKSGTKTNFIAMLLTSRNLNDFLTNVDTITRVVNLDKTFIDELNDKKAEFDDQVKNLNEQKESVVKLNEENEVKLKEFNEMKASEEGLLGQLKAEKESVGDKLTEVERPLVEKQIATARNSSSTIEQLKSAINELSNLKSQIISVKIESEINSAIEAAKVNIKKIEEAQKPVEEPSKGGELAPPSGNASALISYAYQYVGKQYILGATGPNAFDCSGFTQFVFRKFGYSLTRTTYTQVNQGTYVPRDQLKPGDLVFTEGAASSPGHVGIYVGGGKMVHAANSRQGVIVGPIYNYATARRIM